MRKKDHQQKNQKQQGKKRVSRALAELEKGVAEVFVPTIGEKIRSSMGPEPTSIVNRVGRYIYSCLALGVFQGGATAFLFFIWYTYKLVMEGGWMNEIPE